MAAECINELVGRYRFDGAAEGKLIYEADIHWQPHKKLEGETLVARIADHRFFLQMPGLARLSQVSALVDTVRWESLAPEMQLSVLDVALSDILDCLEQGGSGDATLAYSQVDDDAESVLQLRLSFTSGDVVEGQLTASERSLRWLAEKLRLFGPKPRHNLSHLKVDLDLITHQASLSLAEVQMLEAGDVVLVQPVPSPRAAEPETDGDPQSQPTETIPVHAMIAVRICGAHPTSCSMASCQISNDSVAIQSRWTAGGEDNLSGDVHGPDQALAARVILGSVQVASEQLEALGPGATLPLPPAFPSGPLRLEVNSVPLAMGRLVTLSGRSALQLTQVFSPSRVHGAARV